MGSAKPGTSFALQSNVGVTDASTGRVGPSGVTPVGNVAAAVTSGRPQPRAESGAARLEAYARSASRAATGPRAGWSCFTSAAAAAGMGGADDVPDSRRPMFGPPPTPT